MSNHGSTVLFKLTSVGIQILVNTGLLLEECTMSRGIGTGGGGRRPPHKSINQYPFSYVRHDGGLRAVGRAPPNLDDLPTPLMSDYC